MRLIAADKAPWEVQGAEKREAIRRLFSDIAPSYDQFNTCLSLSRHHRWRSIAVSKLQLKPGAKALDLCCGTGDFMRPLRRAVGPAGTVLGLDFCEPMLRLAGAKKLGFLAMGDAMLLPIADETIDSVTVGWGMRNVTDIDAVHREIVRVLKSGGRFASVDMARPRNHFMRAGASFVLGRVAPFLGGLFGKGKAYVYLPKSTERFWGREDLRCSMERAGLVRVGWKDFMLGNVCLHWGEKP